MARPHDYRFASQGFALNLLRMVLIAVCALRLADCSHSSLWGEPLELDAFALWLTGATVFTYHFTNNDLTARYTAWLCGVVAFFSFWWLPAWSQGVGAVSGILWVVYAMALRHHTLAKPLFVALVWVLATHVALGASGPYFWPMACHRFGIVLALALVYDLADMRYDTVHGTATLPLRYGKARAVAVAVFAVLLANFIYAVWGVYSWANILQMVGALAVVGITAKREQELGDDQIVVLKMFVDAVLLL